MTTRLHELHKLGQSIWYDNIRRAMLTSGEFDQLLEAGILGVTSNPTIFEKAISGSADYDESFISFLDQGLDLPTIYEKLILADIGAAADKLLPVYERSAGVDGYVSVEVRPTLANDTVGTIEEAKHLFASLQRPNIMIKVPATPEGIPAIMTLIAEGINVNVTLIFSREHYEAVAEAYLSGLEQRAGNGDDLSHVSSVASFFVSRVDTAVDRALDQVGNSSLQGKISIANAKSAFLRFTRLFAGDRWEKLAAAGAQVQRPLWASTGTKNPDYADTLYIEALIGPHTVNTVPPSTLNAYLDHGLVAATLEDDLDLAKEQLAELNGLGIDLAAVTQQLQDEGVASFSKSFDSLMQTLADKKEKLTTGWDAISVSVGDYQEKVDEALNQMAAARVMNRIWSHDHTIWKPQPEEVANRLGWLDIAERTRSTLPVIEDLTASLKEEGYDQALLLGMGGSSLAPEVLRKTFGVEEGYLDLGVLDSTDPDAILEHKEKLDLAKTLFIVSTKSGGTVETLSLFRYFYNQVSKHLGSEIAGAHFVAITDAGSPLDQLATKHNFRAIFRNDANIGGRYSALSYFGMVPAGLIGMDVDTLLDRALTMACNNEGCNEPIEGDNNAALIGAILGELAEEGRDKVTFIISPEIASFGNWLEQLIAESTGKEGKGILPIVGEPLGDPNLYGTDRLFIHIKLAEDQTYDSQVAALEEDGQPVVRIRIEDRYDLGGQFFLWEMATAVAGYRMGINPFDQPNVESAKVLARELVAAFQAKGELPEQKPSLESKNIIIFSDPQMSTDKIETPRQALQSFLADVPPGSYLSLQAYLQTNAESDRVLQDLRKHLRRQTSLATTLGYGPRFLHSTGQLHKGDGGNGYFIQFTNEPAHAVPIPDDVGSDDSSISFGVLKMAQALGDRQALLDANRRVLRVHLKSDPLSGIKQLI